MKNINYIRIRILKISIVFACVLFTSCSHINHEQKLEKIAPASLVSNVCRIAIPSSGGQTIREPKNMEDTQILWSPIFDKNINLPEFKMQISNKYFAEERNYNQSIIDKNIGNHYLYRFTHDRKRLAIQVLKRAEEYTPMILCELRKRNLPQELASLPLVESAFEANAVSPAGAVGLWQLMPETAKRFGLVVNGTIDERFNVIKATGAAISYLAELHTLFNDWPLALAAYNSGEGAMQKAIYQSNCSNLPDLITYTRKASLKDKILKEETLEFVSKIIAAVKIMNTSNSFGLTNKPLLGSLKKDIIIFDNNDQPPLKLIGKYNSNETIEIMPPQSQRLTPY